MSWIAENYASNSRRDYLLKRSNDNDWYDRLDDKLHNPHLCHRSQNSQDQVYKKF